MEQAIRNNHVGSQRQQLGMHSNPSLNQFIINNSSSQSLMNLQFLPESETRQIGRPSNNETDSFDRKYSQQKVYAANGCFSGVNSQVNSIVGTGAPVSTISVKSIETKDLGMSSTGQNQIPNGIYQAQQQQDQLSRKQSFQTNGFGQSSIMDQSRSSKNFDISMSNYDKLDNNQADQYRRKSIFQTEQVTSSRMHQTRDS